MQYRIAWGAGLALAALSIAASSAFGDSKALPTATATITAPSPTLPRPVTTIPLPIRTAVPEIQIADPRIAGSSTAATRSSFTTRLSGTRFEWDFGAGAMPRTLVSSSNTTPPVVLARPGSYTVRVTAHPATGAAQTAQAPYTVVPFRNAQTVTSSWRATVRPHSLAVLPSGDSVVVHCVRPGTLYPLAQIGLARSGSFSAYPVTSAENTCEYPLAALGRDGRLRLLIRKGGGSSNHLTFYTARTTAVPTTAAEWQAVTVATDLSGSTVQLAFRSDGRPVVAYWAQGSPMRIAAATVTVPTEAAHWRYSDGPRFNTDFAFTLLQDRPVFLFRTDLHSAGTSPDNGVRVALASSPDPSGPTDYRLLTLPRPAVASSYGGEYPAVGVHGGQLVAFYRELGNIRLARATQPLPTVASDFAMSNLFDSAVSAPNSGAPPASVSTFQGRLVLTYTSGGEHRIAIALTQTPSGPADWYSFIASTTSGGFSVVPLASEIRVAELGSSTLGVALLHYR
jgi:hypothetical protein